MLCSVRMQTSVSSLGAKKKGFGFAITETTNISIRVDGCNQPVQSHLDPALDQRVDHRLSRFNRP